LDISTDARFKKSEPTDPANRQKTATFRKIKRAGVILKNFHLHLNMASIDARFGRHTPGTLADAIACNDNRVDRGDDPVHGVGLVCFRELPCHQGLFYSAGYHAMRRITMKLLDNKLFLNT